MIITINGTPGSGKSTIAKYLEKKLKLKHYSMGDLRRKMALERGMTIDELNRLGEKEAWTDKDADNYQKKLGEKEDNFIIDGRLSWFFIPKSIKVLVKADLKRAAERIFLAKRSSEKKYRKVSEVLKEIRERIKSDVRRYKKYYRINDIYGIKNYDIIIDTSYLTIHEMNIAALNAILGCRKVR
jgi:predicted cytidylate kinase